MFFLMSIKPKYAAMILAGEKTVEIRKSKLHANHGDVVAIYSTQPEGRIVGYFTVDNVLWDETEVLWESIRISSGLSHEEYLQYANKREMMCGIMIASVTSIDGLGLGKINMHIPQSYRRITVEEFNFLCNREL